MSHWEAVDEMHQTGTCTPPVHSGGASLYLYVVHELIPILHAADHLAYDKSARLNLDTMKKLPEIMTEAQFRTYTKDGYFTIRRKNR